VGGSQASAFESNDVRVLQLAQDLDLLLYCFEGGQAETWTSRDKLLLLLVLLLLLCLLLLVLLLLLSLLLLVLLLLLLLVVLLLVAGWIAIQKSSLW
jgi:hypothetical protein